MKGPAFQNGTIRRDRRGGARPLNRAHGSLVASFPVGRAVASARQARESLMTKRRMAARRLRGFRVLVATDGSRQARNAVAITARFPWPERTRVTAVVARTTRAEFRLSILLAALDRSSDCTARSARQPLSQRWPNVDVAVVDKAPVDAVIGEASVRRRRHCARLTMPISG
jgi:hypothetical protein